MPDLFRTDLTEMKTEAFLHTEGSAPRWNRNGKELTFVSEGSLMTSSVRFDRGFESGPPTRLFGLDFAGDTDYDVAPDGRFLLRAAVPGAPRPSIQIIANWASELKK